MPIPDELVSASEWAAAWRGANYDSRPGLFSLIGGTQTAERGREGEREREMERERERERGRKGERERDGFTHSLLSGEWRTHTRRREISDECWALRRDSQMGRETRP